MTAAIVATIGATQEEPPALARRGRSDQQWRKLGNRERQAADAPALGTRASANTSGPDFTLGLEAR